MAQIKLNPKIVIEACEKAEKETYKLLRNAQINIVSMDDKDPKKPKVDEIDNPLIKQTMLYAKWFNQIRDINELAEFSENYGLLEITIDHNDFALIGEYLPEPTTYSSHPESGTIKCIRCDEEWVAGQQKCLKCGSLYSN